MNNQNNPETRLMNAVRDYVDHTTNLNGVDLATNIRFTEVGHLITYIQNRVQQVIRMEIEARRMEERDNYRLH